MAGIPQPGFRRHQGKAEDTRHLRRPQSLRPGRGARAGPGVFPHRKEVLKAPDTSKARVLVVGDVMLDRYWFGEVSRIAPEAAVPVVLIDHEDERLGGAANVAWNCKELNARIRLLSVVGRDEPGERLEKLLKGKGIEASLHRDRGLHTTQKLRVIGRKQQLLRNHLEKAPSSEALASELGGVNHALAGCGPGCRPVHGTGGLGAND